MTTIEAIDSANDRSKAMDARLLDDWQRDLPITPRPFLAMARALAVPEDMVIERLRALRESGVVARVGGVVRPNTLGASTLAAVAAPELYIDEVAAALARIPGINHIYLRENALNLWFVVTGPDRDYVDAVLSDIERTTGLPVLDLRLQQAYHIDLGFALDGVDRRRYHDAGSATATSGAECDDIDRTLAQILTDGLPLVQRPFAEVGRRLQIDEVETITRVQRLLASGVVPRMGVIIRHRALGWRSNAMVVFDVAPEHVAAAGATLAKAPGINLCYQRTRYAEAWPFNLYCMIHARSREEALDTLDVAMGSAGLHGVPMRILFSLRCFKQTGALIAKREAA